MAATRSRMTSVAVPTFCQLDQRNVRTMREGLAVQVPARPSFILYEPGGTRTHDDWIKSREIPPGPIHSSRPCCVLIVYSRTYGTRKSFVTKRLSRTGRWSMTTGAVMYAAPGRGYLVSGRGFAVRPEPEELLPELSDPEPVRSVDEPDPLDDPVLGRGVELPAESSELRV